MHESCWCRRLVSCYWDTAAGGSEKTSRAPVLNASVHLVTAEPHLLHDCMKVMAVFLRAARVPANTPHPGLFTSKHTFCHCHQLSVSFSAVLLICGPHLDPFPRSSWQQRVHHKVIAACALKMRAPLSAHLLNLVRYVANLPALIYKNTSLA